MGTLLADIWHWMIDLDTSIFLSVNSRHNAYWDTFMWLVSRKFVWVPFYASIAYVIFRSYRWKVIVPCLLAMSLIFFITDSFSNDIVRPYVARMRPGNLDNPLSVWVHIVDNHRGGRYGFPSCHAANAWGLALFAWMLFRRSYLTLFMVGWAVLMCYSRLYLGVHYFGDALVGMLIALVASSGCYYVFRRLTGYQASQPLCDPYFPIFVGSATILLFLLLSPFIPL